LGLPLFAGTALAAETGNHLLADAAKHGDRDAVRSALNGLAKEDVAGPEGTAALIWAADRDDLETVDLLLRAGADVKAVNEFGATALYAAAAANANSTLIARLLAAGADPDQHLLSGETPIMEAARQGNLDTVRALLLAGADPNAKELNGGQTALMWAISEGHSAVTEELVRHGADIQARSKKGFTPLMFAGVEGDTESARILLAAGAKPNDRMPKTRVTPLIIACAMGHPDTAAVMLDNGADPNLVDVNGLTALHRAVRDSDRGVDPESKAAAVLTVKVLLAHGANPNARMAPEKKEASDKGQPVGDRAGDRDGGAVTTNGVVLLGATPVALAAEVNNLDAIKALVEGGADPLIPTERKTSPLILAVGGGTDVLRPRSPQERAMAVETARFLVEHGADVNAPGEFGWTPLHAAAYQGLDDAIAFLVSKGAKLDTKDRFGQTPLTISLSILTKGIGTDRRLQIPRIYRKETSELLLKLGATPVDRSGVEVVLQRHGDPATQ
jgi:cytohesin